MHILTCFIQKHIFIKNAMVTLVKCHLCLPLVRYWFMYLRGQHFSSVKRRQGLQMTYNTFYAQREKGGKILWEVFLSIKEHYSWKKKYYIIRRNNSRNKHFNSKLHNSSKYSRANKHREMRTRGSICPFAQAYIHLTSEKAQFLTS